ncbi:MAG: polysaccharide biosynthesis tyrosine autokinase [Oscillospiraceae bacterium]|nr:polysaccharide biosynthesis tyrosine autokinase [Oscillospiraceae bacterium]
MKDRVIDSNDEVVIDFQKIFNALVKKIWLIAIAAVAGAVLAFLVTFYLITPQYQSSAMFYVNNSTLSVGDVSLGITSSDITASKNLVNSYIVILNTRETLNDVIDYSGVEDVTYRNLMGMIEAESVNNTEIFRVTVTADDPEKAEQLANAIAHILPKRISSIIDGTSSKVVESAVVEPNAVSPSYSKNTVIGFLAGLLLVAAVIALREIMDITIRNEEDIARVCKYPVLAAVPDMAAQHKRGYGYYYGYGGYGAHGVKKAYEQARANEAGHVELVGSGISFAASEAYKLLRTKLQFSFAEENGTRVIGVSSSLTGEGKSLTSVNLAYAMSQLDKRVLLIDCDMRRPSIADKLPVARTPGLSDYLSGQCSMDKLFQPCGIKEDEKAYNVISAGRIPPNPMELLSSPRMAKMVERLKAEYDYIFLDLPPVSEVGDALAIAKITDGMLLVVRQNYCNSTVLNASVRQFEFVEARILGTVLNASNEEGHGYGGKYYRKYSNSYAGAGQKVTGAGK